MSETIEDLVLRLAKERGEGKTLCPTEAAKAAAAQRGEENWQGRLPAVKAAAARLARRGAVAIYRKGKPVDPEGFKGIYRIGLPQAAAAANEDAPEGKSVIPAEAEGEEPGSPSD